MLPIRREIGSWVEPLWWDLPVADRLRPELCSNMGKWRGRDRRPGGVLIGYEIGSDLAAKVTQIVERAGAEQVMPWFRRLRGSDILEKAPGEVVTTVDRQCEQWLAEELSSLVPGSQVLGEEAVAGDRSRLDMLHDPTPTWIVDPLDGTANFVAGSPNFAVMVALVADGATIGGWIHQPVANRTGWAILGRGASINGRPVRVANPVSLDNAVGYLCRRAFTGEHERGVDRLRELLASHRHLGCAGVEYLNLATGKAHLAVSGKLVPWDHAAGVLIHGEAGGYSALISGAQYSARVHSGLMLVAPSRATWDVLRTEIHSPAPPGADSTGRPQDAIGEQRDE